MLDIEDYVLIRRSARLLRGRGPLREGAAIRRSTRLQDVVRRSRAVRRDEHHAVITAVCGHVDGRTRDIPRASRGVIRHLRDLDVVREIACSEHLMLLLAVRWAESPPRFIRPPC